MAKGIHQNSSKSTKEQMLKRSILRSAFTIGISSNYDDDINPQDYERYALGRLNRRNVLAYDIGNLLQQYVPVQTQKGYPSTVLDVAAGTGIVSRELAARGYNVVAVDLSEKFLTYLRKQNASIRTLVTDMNANLPFDDNSFEGITVAGANRYIANTANFLEEILRILKPGGIFVWPVFPMEMPFWKMKAGLRQPTSTKSLAQQAKEHGFKEVAIVNNPIYVNIFRKGARMSFTYSFIIAQK